MYFAKYIVNSEILINSIQEIQFSEINLKVKHAYLTLEKYIVWSAWTHSTLRGPLDTAAP